MSELIPWADAFGPVPWVDGVLSPDQLTSVAGCDHHVEVEWTRDGGALVYAHDGDIILVLKRAVIDDPETVHQALARVIVGIIHDYHDRGT